MTLRKSLYILGVIVLLVSFWYLVSLLSQYKEALADWQLTGERLVALSGITAGYIVALFCLAEGWHRVLLMTSRLKGDRRDSYVSLLSSQIIKYFPLGVFHLAGRHVWLRKQGHEHTDLAKAVVLETIYMVSVSLMLGTALGLIFITELPSVFEIWGLSFPMLPMMALGLVAGIGLNVAAGLGLIKGIAKARFKEIVVAQIWFALFFFVQSVMFIECYQIVSGSEASISMVSILLLSWLAGYVVIGAPGGLGVREMVFLLLGGTFLPVEEALLAILIFRVVAILGEVVVFFLGGSLKLHQRIT